MKRTLWLAVIVLWSSPNLPGQGLTVPKQLPPDLGPVALLVTGIDGKSISLTAVDLAKLPQQTVKAADHGSSATFQGVLLSDVLSNVATPAGEKYRSKAASYYVLAQGADGYRAVLSWAEVDSSFTDRKIYVVISRDGRPLAGKDGPFMTVVPDDKRQSRWVRQVTELIVKQADATPM